MMSLFQNSKPRSSFLLLLLLVAVGTTLFYTACLLPIHVDEAITHRHFAAEGWKVAISTYPFPNNHLLFSFLASFFVYLPFDSLLSMRLISMLSALVSSSLVYWIVKRYTNEGFGLLAVLVWLTSLGGMYYSVHARGYGLQTTFILISTFSVIKWKECRSSNSHGYQYLVLFMISSSLGFFTVPTYLFPFLSLLVWLVFQNRHGIASLKSQIKYAIIAGAGTTILTLALYSPLFYYTGISAVLDNQWVDERKWENLSEGHWQSFLPDLYAYLGPAILTILFLSILTGIKKGGGRQVFLLTIIIIPPVVLMLIMGSLPFPRTFAYLSAVLTVLAFVGMSNVKSNLRKPVSAVTVILVIYAGYNLITQFSDASQRPANQSREAHSILSEKTANDTIYSKGWNECGQLIDYYTWRENRGPKVSFVYSEQKWAEITRKPGPVYLMEQGKKEDKIQCSEVWRKSSIAVYRCN